MYKQCCTRTHACVIHTRYDVGARRSNGLFDIRRSNNSDCVETGLCVEYTSTTKFKNRYQVAEDKKVVVANRKSAMKLFS